MVFRRSLLPAAQETPTYRLETIPFERVAAEAGLVQGWEMLDAAAALPTQTYAFSAALSGSLLAGSYVEVMLALSAVGIGGLLPLCRDGGYLSRWRLIGAREVFEPGDALYASPDAARALARSIARQARPLRLDRLPADSLIVPALREAMRGRGFVSVRPAVSCPKITLDPTWRDPESRFNAGRRSDFRRAARRASVFGTVTCEVLAPDLAEFDRLFDEAIGVEVRSWKKGAGSALATDRAKEAFFRRFFRAACADGTFRIAFLRIDGQAVAMQMAIQRSERYWLFKIGYDEAYGKCSPGTLLMLHTLGWAAQRGLKSYELLGNVERWIADFWTREQNDCVQLRTYPLNPRGLLTFLQDSAVWLGSRLWPSRAQSRA